MDLSDFEKNEIKTRDLVRACHHAARRLRYFLHIKPGTPTLGPAPDFQGESPADHFARMNGVFG